MSGNQIDNMVTTTLVKWIKRLLDGGTPPRINLRFVFGDPKLVDGVKAVLESENAAGPHHFVVRASSDADAVRLRHGTPAGARPGATTVYVLFWQPGTSEHERNAQSLTDVRAVEVADVLGRAASFVLDGEQAIFGQCDEAAIAWKEQHRERAREHLRAAWDGVRTCLRERRGGRQRSIAFAGRIDAYCRFLAAARIPDEEWAATTPALRAPALLRRWGESLPELNLFAMPALGSVLGVRTRPDAAERIESAKRTREDLWPDVLAQVLGENVEYAVDFSALAEALAGKKTLTEQLDLLVPRVPLCQDAASRDSARAALERFCHDGDDTAFRKVEWLFLQDSDNRRSASLGLKGLLLARGRRTPGPDPLERAVADTVAALDALVGADSPAAEMLRAFVAQQRAAVVMDSRNAATMVEVLQALAQGGSPESSSPDLAAAYDRAREAPGRKPEVLQRLAKQWNALIAKQPEKAVEAPTLLLGLARLCAQRAGESPPTDGRYRIDGMTQNDLLVLALLTSGREQCRLEIPVRDWGATVARLAKWAREDLRAALFPNEEEEQESDDLENPDERDEITIEVRRRSGGSAEKPLGLLTLYWSSRARRMWRSLRSEVPMSWSCDLVTGDTVPSGYKLVRALQDVRLLKAKAEAPQAESVGATWQQYVKSAGAERGWEVAAMIAPTSDSASECVNAWAAAVEECARQADSAGASKRREELQAQIALAIEEERFQELKLLNAELKNLPATASVAGPELMKDARSLLRLATVSFNQDGKSKVLALTPHHPLVTRFRALGDRVLADVLQLIWTDGWPSVAHEDLIETLTSWGAPEPMHAYGYWDGEPLAFDGWLEGWTAIFARLGAGRTLDAASLGAREVGRVVTRYCDLFPASADRLKLRIRGDQEARWVMQILAEQFGSPVFRADVNVVTMLGSREQTAVEQALYAGRQPTEPFELGPEGILPRVRIRRCRDADLGSDPMHMALLVGDQIDAFQPTWHSCPPVVGGRVPERWDAAILFAEPSPALRGYAFNVSDPDDALANSVARVVGIACGATATVFTERYAFDPSRCEEPLRQQQGNAHWLVLASRQPLYRAVQQAGNKIASLLDFYTLVERGRPVHVCVSLNSMHAAEDLKRIDGALAELLLGNARSFSGQALVSAALKLAPGLAMHCVGATGAAQLGGLLGLLLTGATLWVDHPNAIILSLDQHEALLSGGGRLGDLLIVQHLGGTVHIGVAESKFSTGVVDATSGPAADAKRQIESSIARLEHLGVSHPVSLRTRNQLVRALAHQVHMAPAGDAYLERAEALIAGVRDPRIPIVIDPLDRSVIHVWSVAESTADEQVTAAGLPTVTIHGRGATLDRLAKLGGLPIEGES